MTTRQAEAGDGDGDAAGGSGPGPVRWRSDRDYSADWTEARFADNWRAYDDHESGGERTPPMCSLCGFFIRQPTSRWPAPSSDRDASDRRDNDRQEEDRSDHEMDDNFCAYRFDGIADDRPEIDAEDRQEGDASDDDNENDDNDNNDDDDDNESDEDDDEDGVIVTPADILQFFMSQHQSSALLPGDSDDDSDDVLAFERHREAVERHMVEEHVAPIDYSLDPKDFLPPRPNPSVFVSFTVPVRKEATAARTPDEIFDEVSAQFAELKVGAVPRATVHGWARVLAQGLGRETRSLKGTVGELLYLCYDLQWRKANAAAAAAAP